MSDLTEIQIDFFKHYGFERNEWYDKNHSQDKFNTLKFIEFSKALRDSAVVSVCFCYTSENGEDWNLHEVSHDLEVGGAVYPLNIKHLFKLKELLKLLK